MKDKKAWITQGIKISAKHKRSPYTFTKNSNDPKAKGIIWNNKILRIVKKKEARKQHYTRLRAKFNNGTKTTWNIVKIETGKVQSLQQVPILLVNDEKFMDPTNVANAFNNFFVTVTEKLNIQHIRWVCYLNSKLFISWNFPSTKIIPITEGEIKNVIHSIKQKKNQVMMK